jgi:hypothetical protein
MKITRSYGGEYPDCIVNYFDLDDYKNNLDDENVIFWGWSSLYNQQIQNENNHYKNKIFINTAQPCDIINGISDIEKQFYFDKVYTICPYTSKIFDFEKESKFIPICFPFNEKYFKKYDNITKENKKYDVIYYGQIHSPMYKNLIDTISKFNYRISCNDILTYEKYNLSSKITNLGLSSRQKWDLLSECKICVGFNLIFISDNHINNLKQINNINNFEKIDKIYEKKMMPQMKTRMIESALTKTLMLIYKDDWNVIENWFTPNEDFIYFENFEDLEEKISNITKNFSDYWWIIENANKKVKEYSLDKLLK